jgi:hypothetical protein
MPTLAKVEFRTGQAPPWRDRKNGQGHIRGAYRSAMIEASAAFDLCLVRKIREGLRAKSKGSVPEK